MVLMIEMKQVSILLSNALARRLQIFTLTNGNPVHWRTHTSLGLGILKYSFIELWYPVIALVFRFTIF